MKQSSRQNQQIVAPGTILPPGSLVYYSYDEQAESFLKQLFIESARKVLPRFVIDAENREVVNMLFYYFTQSDKSTLDPRKGILISGGCGVGKSILLEAFREFVKIAAMRTCAEVKGSYLITTANQISSEWADTGKIDRYLRNRDQVNGRPLVLCIDDLGIEPPKSVHMGTARNVMEYLLHERDRYFVKEGLLTHVTTNLDPKLFKARYGEVIQDRVRQMFNIIPMEGKSRRV